jgi:hypothetical protein
MPLPACFAPGRREIATQTLAGVSEAVELSGITARDVRSSRSNHGCRSDSIGGSFAQAAVYFKFSCPGDHHDSDDHHDAARDWDVRSLAVTASLKFKHAPGIPSH